MEYSEEYLVLRERVPSSTDRTSVSETVADGSHVPVGQDWRNGSSINLNEILFSI